MAAKVTSGAAANAGNRSTPPSSARSTSAGTPARSSAVSTGSSGGESMRVATLPASNVAASHQAACWPRARTSARLRGVS